MSLNASNNDNTTNNNRFSPSNSAFKYNSSTIFNRQIQPINAYNDNLYQNSGSDFWSKFPIILIAILIVILIILIILYCYKKNVNKHAYEDDNLEEGGRIIYIR